MAAGKTKRERKRPGSGAPSGAGRHPPAVRDRILRRHILALLEGGGAHVTFDDAIEGIPPASRGVRPPGSPFTAWELLEHMRIAIEDILRFIRDPGYRSPDWPGDYWPEDDAPPGKGDWEASVAAVREHLMAMKALVASARVDLLAPIPHGTGQTILREALLVADHNSYHMGELVLLRKLLGIWER